jgi:hypothetical protein
MELHPSSSFRPRRPHSSESREPSPSRDDPAASASILSRVFNWCLLEGCRAIIRCGRFYVKKGLRGQFQQRYLLLLPGTLLEFVLASRPSRLTSSAKQPSRASRYQTHQRDLHVRPIPTVYHRRKSTLSLRGCYVYSGRLATSLLAQQSNGTWDPADYQQKFPRIYTSSDGLRVSDEEEDCTLVVFKRSSGGEGRFGKSGQTRILRARSMVSGFALVGSGQE